MSHVPMPRHKSKYPWHSFSVVVVGCITMSGITTQLHPKCYGTLHHTSNVTSSEDSACCSSILTLILVTLLSGTSLTCMGRTWNSYGPEISAPQRKLPMQIPA